MGNRVKDWLHRGTGWVSFHRPSPQNARLIVVDGTEPRSRLNLRPARGKTTVIREFQFNGPMGKVAAPGLELRGDFKSSQSISSVKPLKASHDTITIGGSQTNRLVQLRFNSAEAFSVLSGPPIGRLVTALGWFNDPGAENLIQGPWMGQVRSLGPSTANQSVMTSP